KIDDKEVMVPKGTTILEAAKSVGVTVPHYCYHPGLSIAGNCRMCLVEVEKMPKPMIGCNTVVTEGMVVTTQSPKVKQMQKSVMEFLLINHPLDCPTCDQSGECRLQDYYMDYDEVPTRFEEEKVHKDKMIDLGANVMLDQERCIACTRCIRVCQEVAKKDELCLANRGDHVTITTFPGKELSNPYAGNTIDVCPVGALTNKDFRYKKRVWLLSRTESVCPGCSRGCNIEINHADSTVYRLLPRHNPEVNSYWMCDEGRYGYKNVNENRWLIPKIRVSGALQEISYEDALEKLAERLQQAQEIALVAHARETNETLAAFHAFGKNVLKTKKLYFSRNEPKNPFFDDFLITVDKNPNQASIDALGFEPLEKLDKAKGVIILNDLSPADLDWLKQKKIPVLALWAANQNAVCDLAEIIFPIPTYAEQDGHFTNVQGKVQKISRAFAPKGEAQPVVYSLKILSEMMCHPERSEGSFRHAG
ncbi:MAG: 2Fe-2S iron-sulfur cluster-binding protein, partial [Deltaproteobacteria bacterium]|nr:2Fe-2S iron-sulfur cluster-binding protein [Deltaproteobacteria bacterium]